jgi:hypothetical protein
VRSISDPLKKHLKRDDMATFDEVIGTARSAGVSSQTDSTGIIVAPCKDVVTQRFADAPLT